jgi:hypothetical protein
MLDDPAGAGSGGAPAGASARLEATPRDGGQSTSLESNGAKRARHLRIGRRPMAPGDSGKADCPRGLSAVRGNTN